MPVDTKKTTMSLTHNINPLNEICTSILGHYSPGQNDSFLMRKLFHRHFLEHLRASVTSVSIIVSAKMKTRWTKGTAGKGLLPVALQIQ